MILTHPATQTGAAGPDPVSAAAFIPESHQNEHLLSKLQKEAPNTFLIILTVLSSIHKLCLIALTYFMMTFPKQGTYPWRLIPF